MAAIKSAALAFLLINAAVVFSQTNPRPVLLAAETAAIRKKLSDTKLSPSERKAALERMARLFELSGNAEGAAEAWLEAAGALPGGPDHNALFRGVRFLAAQGEFSRALESLPVSAGQARLLAAQLEAFSGGGTAGLEGLLKDPASAGYKPAIYYTLWRISGDLSARSRLLAEFPRSPEARIVHSEGSEFSDSGGVDAAPALLWLLAGKASGPSAGQTSVIPAGTAADSPSMLQTGLFGREENARALAERLRTAGFNPVVAKKAVNGAERWVVGVTPGPDPSRTMLLLKDRGFESFPVY